MKTMEPGFLFKGHPWHGISLGPEAPRIVTCYIEIVPSDTIKYEVDKISGLLKIDRPQQYSNYCPTLYGLLPQTYCGEGLGAYTGQRISREAIIGDGDPLDICVLTEKTIPRGDILLQAIPIGGLRLIDRNQADDKIIAVLRDDAVFGRYSDIADCPSDLLDRLRHYFLTYKQAPGQPVHPCEITDTYGQREAREIINICREDYRSTYPGREEALNNSLKGPRKAGEHAGAAE